MFVIESCQKIEYNALFMMIFIPVSNFGDQPLEGQGCGIIMGVTCLLLLGPFYSILFCTRLYCYDHDRPDAHRFCNFFRAGLKVDREIRDFLERRLRKTYLK